MRATAFAIPCKRLLSAIAGGQAGRLELASYIAATAELLDGPADVVILAVPAGEGHTVVDKLVGSNRPPKVRPPARYISEAGLSESDLDDLIVG